jgi:uncharacterized protein (DUF342 family)
MKKDILADLGEILVGAGLLDEDQQKGWSLFSEQDDPLKGKEFLLQKKKPETEVQEEQKEQADTSSSSQPEEKTPEKREQRSSSFAGQPDGLVLELSDDQMQAFLSVDKSDKELVTKEFLQRLFRFRGVSFGINWMQIDDILDRLSRDHSVECELIAEGLPPIEGKSAQVNYYFEKEKQLEINHSSQSEDEKVDYRRSKKINMVSKGVLLAEKLDMIPGVDGKNVRGNVVKATPVFDKPLVSGKGTVLDEQNQLWATVDGRPVFEPPGRVTVLQVYTVYGDTDLNTGDIEFNGDVEITGNVRSGYQIKAGGNVFVKGSVEAAFIQAGGNITVGGSYAGGEKGLLRCGGHCYISHCNGGSIETEGNLEVAKELVNAKVFVGGSLYFTKLRGSMMGGEAYIMGDLEVVNLGSNLGVTTNINMGNKKLLRRKLKQMNDQIDAIKDKRAVIKESMDKLAEELAKDDKKAKQTRIKLVAIQAKLADIINRLRVEKESIAKNLGEYSVHFIRVSGIVFPGVKIYFGDILKEIEEKIKGIEYFEAPDTNKIVSRPYKKF